MSAYVVDKDHIDFMVQAAIAGGTDSQGWETAHGGFSWYHDGKRHAVKPHLDVAEDGMHSEEIGPSVLGQRLVDECVRSVHGRYPEDDVDAGELPGPCDCYYLLPYVWEPVSTSQTLSIGAGLRPIIPAPESTVFIAHQLSHYEYQSCEHEEWRGSEAFAFCQAMREHLLAKLPGGESAPWGFTREPAQS